MYLHGLCRLGRDAELRYLTDGTPVLGMALAYNYGKKDDQGNRPTQWIDASLFGAMKAGRINIVSTAEGAGVHIGPGQVSGTEGVSVSSAGDLVVSGQAHANSLDASRAVVQSHDTGRYWPLLEAQVSCQRTLVCNNITFLREALLAAPDAKTIYQLLTPAQDSHA